MSEEKIDRRSPKQIEEDALNGVTWGKCPDCKKKDLIHGDFMCCAKCFIAQS